MDGSLSKNVQEGDAVRFTVGRSRPALGTATVNWQIIGINATQDFVETKGFIVFQRVSSFLIFYFLSSTIPHCFREI